MITNKRDYYEILGIQKNATASELKKAYRQKAMLYHPDKNPGSKESEDKFKEAAEAYEVLKEPEKRGLYDRFGHEGLKGAGVGFGGFEDVFSSFGGIFDDFFSFGGTRGGGGTGARQGADLRYDLEIAFKDAVFGKEMDIKLEKKETCSTCNSTGVKPGTKPEDCSKCRGAGKVTVAQGFFSITTTCPQCHGEGKIVKTPCNKCRGTGAVTEPKTLNLKIPPGVDTGTRMRLQGEGEPGRLGGPAGDLYVFIHVKSHEFFERRDGYNVYCKVPISFPQAALGTELEVPTLDSVYNLSIPAGTQSNTTFLLKGAGIQHIKGYSRGDQIIEVYLKTPERLNPREEELFRELAEIREEKVLEKNKGFFQKYKKKK